MIHLEGVTFGILGHWGERVLCELRAPPRLAGQRAWVPISQIANWSEGTRLLAEEEVPGENEERIPTIIPGHEVFQLHDQEGIPPDILVIWAAEHGFGIDWEGYDEERKKRGYRKGPRFP